MIQRLLILAIMFLLGGAACQTEHSSNIINRAANPRTGDSANLSAQNAAVTPEKTENVGGQTVNFDAPDGVKIVGTFYAAAQDNSPAVLMLHQFGSNRASYRNLARQFQAAGIAVLAIDGRGFGDSTKKTDGSKVDPSQSNEAVAGMRSDVAAAVKFLREQKNVDKTRIGIVGASYGSSLAVIYAADDSTIKAVALLSPGTNYFANLPTIPAIEKYGPRPILIVAAEDDAESAEASRKLDKLAAGNKHQLQIIKKGGHGTGILDAGVGLDTSLLEFFRQSL